MTNLTVGGFNRQSRPSNSSRIFSDYHWTMTLSSPKEVDLEEEIQKPIKISSKGKLIIVRYNKEEPRS